MTHQSNSSSDVDMLLEASEDHEPDSQSHDFELDDYQFEAYAAQDGSDDDENALFCKLITAFVEESLDSGIEKDKPISQELGVEDTDTHYEGVSVNAEETMVQEPASKSKKKSPKGVSSKLSRKEQEIAKAIGRRNISTGKNQKSDGANFYIGSTQKGRQSQTKTTRLSDEELRSLFVQSDIVKISEINSELNTVPVITSSVRKVALEEMVASIPTEQQAEARSDKERINVAIKQFDHKPKSDQQGLWQIKGLKTSLYHHQVRKSFSWYFQYIQVNSKL